MQHETPTDRPPANPAARAELWKRFIAGDIITDHTGARWQHYGGKRASGLFYWYGIVNPDTRATSEATMSQIYDVADIIAARNKESHSDA